MKCASRAESPIQRQFRFFDQRRVGRQHTGA
jgi:hypothetical protein